MAKRTIGGYNPGSDLKGKPDYHIALTAIALIAARHGKDPATGKELDGWQIITTNNRTCTVREADALAYISGR